MEEQHVTIESKFLYLGEICKYLEAGPNSRNLKEGECVLNGGLVISCGSVKKSDCEMQLLGLCLQTSGLTKDPHQVSGTIILEEDAKIGDFKCSCKAGESGKCKHIAAMLLYLNRNDIMSLEDLSVTDLTCLWSKLKVPSLHEYAPTPLQQFCHVKQSPRLRVSKSFMEEACQMLIAACPESALAKHKAGRRCVGSISEAIQEEGDPNTSQDSRDFITALYAATEDFGTGPLFELEVQNLATLQDCCATCYSSLLLDKNEAIVLCDESQHSKKKWDDARQFRITGSRCYNIYTYGNSKKLVDWPSKAYKYFWPARFTTKFTDHGIFFESHARNAYKTFVGVDVKQIGLFVCLKHPWLAYSADGVVCESGIPTKLLEIKCPLLGKQQTAQDLVDCVKYIYFDSTHSCFQLKKKHQYYGQVQLGMCLLNLKSCDFVLYSSFDNSIQVISVAYDEEFVSILLKKLKYNYFNRMLHQVCVKKNQA